MLQIAVVHGPNLNLLGSREPGRYGHATLAEIDATLVRLGQELGAEVHSFQANGEGALVDHIQAVGPTADGILINPAGYTHTSVAIRDALLAVDRPCVEVHVTNPDAREPFRHRSLVADIAVGRVAGFGAGSYSLGLRGLVGYLLAKASSR